jgi:H+/Cl- antiporter ClcA
MVRQMLVASTSLGVSSVFGATIGGVLLAVEITSTYYLVAQYFKVRILPLCILDATMLCSTGSHCVHCKRAHRLLQAYCCLYAPQSTANALQFL